MMTWEELLKNRRRLPIITDSSAMLQAMARVRERWPGAEIVKTGEKEWRLMDGENSLSSGHNSHYACYVEALDGLGQ